MPLLRAEAEPPGRQVLLGRRLEAGLEPTTARRGPCPPAARRHDVAGMHEGQQQLVHGSTTLASAQCGHNFPSKFISYVDLAS